MWVFGDLCDEWNRAVLWWEKSMLLYVGYVKRGDALVYELHWVLELYGRYMRQGYDVNVTYHHLQFH